MKSLNLCDPTSVGFKKILLEPVFPEGLGSVSVGYESPYGTIASSWTRKGDNLSWHVTIPANTTATVKVPARFNLQVSGNSAFSFAEGEGGVSTVELGSGDYLLRTK
ncbi:MAG: hypothetical protein LBH84_08820 [Prevotellaceae bacterium]|nr:hypothetical protein [Prevotellaceae bacterium]